MTNIQAAVNQLVSKDLSSKRCEYLFRFPGLKQFSKYIIQDSRDEPALQLVANVALTTVPCALLVLLYCTSHSVGAAYLVLNYALYLQRFMLTLHFTEHRRLFKQEYGWMNNIAPFVLSPLFGVPPGLYRPHHVVMHHLEDNQRGFDASSTEAFQRDNFLHFLWYWCRFWIGAWFELPAYHVKKSRHDLLAVTLGSEACFWAAVAGLWRYNWVGTLWTLVIPFLLSSFLAMFGNWSQHVFVDPDGTHDTYRSTYNALACRDNRYTYNDGYHIMHHLNSRTHWSELPTKFLEQLDEHDKHDALVFHSLGFFDVGLAVFTGRLDYLARHIVPCGPRQAQRTQEEWIKLLRNRLKPVPPRPKKQLKTAQKG